MRILKGNGYFDNSGNQENGYLKTTDSPKYEIHRIQYKMETIFTDAKGRKK